MTCGGCAAAIQTTLAGKPGVATAEVNFEAKTARVRYDPSRISIEQLTAAIGELGYAAALRWSGFAGVSR